MIWLPTIIAYPCWNSLASHPSSVLLTCWLSRSQYSTSMMLYLSIVVSMNGNEMFSYTPSTGYFPPSITGFRHSTKSGESAFDPIHCWVFLFSTIILKPSEIWLAIITADWASREVAIRLSSILLIFVLQNEMFTFTGSSISISESSWKKETMDLGLGLGGVFSLVINLFRIKTSLIILSQYLQVYIIIRIVEMGKRRITKKFAQVKRIISTQDHRIKTNQAKQEVKQKKLMQQRQKQAPEGVQIQTLPKQPSCLFFMHNSALGPPYRLLIDTNFINFSVQNKLDIFKSSMDCLLGKCIPYITDCVIAELEKFGVRYRVALKISKDPRFERLQCDHKGTYADDCIVDRVRQHRCYIVATCDKDLKRRIRKIPGVPIMYIASHKYTVERMAEAYGAPR